MNKTEINKPCKVPIEQKIILKDGNPISLPMRRIPYHIRGKVKEKVDDLIERILLNIQIHRIMHL